MKRLIPPRFLFALLIPSAPAFALILDNQSATHATLASETVTMSGHSELHLTGGGDPIPGTTINLTSEDSWVFFHAMVPSAADSLLPRIKVNGAPAVADANVRLVQYVNGSVVIPHPSDFRPLTVFTGQNFTGSSKDLELYTEYGETELGAFNDRIRSFTLKRGYMATFARLENGTGDSRVYIAQDSDLEIAVLPSSFDGYTSFVRVFPWRWTSKKGSCDVSANALWARWHYNWNISMNSARDWEYVAIKQQPAWPSTNQNWEAREVNHLSGFNEPDNPVEDAYQNLTPLGSVSNAVSRMPELLGTGLRLGAPAVTDAGTPWITNFINQANAAGHRIDYVPVHYYRSQWNNNPTDAAAALYNFLKSIHDVAQRPIWVTEFNNGANWTDNAHDPTTEQNRAVIEAMINMMDDTPWIERYAIYSNVEWFRKTHYDDGSLTPMGNMYRSHQAPMAHQQEVPNNGKAGNAHFLFEGNTRDTSGNGNPCLTYGTPSFEPGKNGTALSLDGSHDHLRLAGRFGDSTDFTFASWVKWDGGAIWQRVFDFGNGTARNMFLTPKSGDNTLRFAIKNGGNEQRLNSTILPVGVWTHVAVTISGNTGKLFVNGSIVDTNNAMTINPSEIGTEQNYIGKSQWPDALFDGSLDDLRIHNYALSDAEIAAAASAGPIQFASDTLVMPTARPLQPFTASLDTHVSPSDGSLSFAKLSGPPWLAIAADGTLTGVPSIEDIGTNIALVSVTTNGGTNDTTTIEIPVAELPGMVLRYPFNGDSNSSIGSANGIPTGTPSYTAGHHGDSFFFSGDDQITLPAGIANHNEITIATWIRWSGGNQWQRIFDFGNGTGEYLFLTPRSGGNTLRFGITSNSTEQQLNAPQLPANTWAHVAVTLGSGIGKLYLNGSLIDTQTITTKPSDLRPLSNYLGKSQFANDPALAGQLDEFVIFNYALDASTVSALHAGSSPAFTSASIVKPDAIIDADYVQSIGDPGDGLIYTKAAGPAWLTVEPDGRLSGVPTSSDAGLGRFKVRVTNHSGYTDEASMDVFVQPSSDLIALYQFIGNANDATGSHDGTANGGPTYPESRLDQSVDLDGADDDITLPAGIVSSLSDMTIAAHIRWDGGNAWQRVFDFGNGTGSYFFLTPSGGGNLRFAIKDGTTEQRLNGPSLPTNEWSHVTVTLVGNTGTLYLNGVPVDTQTITLNPSDIAPALNYIGRSQYTADPHLNGRIDELRIYNHGLSTQEVAALAAPTSPSIVPRPPYEAWTLTHPFPAGQELPDSDPDGGSAANAFEFLFGTNPLNPTDDLVPAGVILSAAELGLPGEMHYLSITARLRIDRAGIEITAEAAAELMGLSLPTAAEQVIQLSPTVPDGDFEFVTWYYETAIEDSPIGFMRLRTTED